MSNPNLINEIKVDHDNMRDLLDRFKDAHQQRNDALCTDIANTIIHEAAVHSDAEEMSIYTTMDQHGMHSTAEQDRNEHQQVKQLMANLDSHGISTVGLDEYAKRVVEACELFLRHADEEEKEQLPRLVEALSDNDQCKAVNDFLRARELAPTRPHPAAPQSGGIAQKTMGAVGKAADVALDKGRHFVELRHHHREVHAA
ncbi:hypothetical protein PANT_12c00004 [Moesziomyces antarcticus T-34]|uniref:Hemerythrin-like domain-containing protein n=1 Tax=Pseudozyma antarctica (strain T-34) TaxID=1151754 RepID=M9LW98_PSEA3|nr:hypothetical protein PANT_12c00004 [Moesziomyces antarcticus T-34]